MTEPYATDDELADKFGKSPEWVRAKARAGWPHLRVGKSYRFTAEQVAAIEALLTVTPKAKPGDNAWGYKGRTA